MDAAADIAKAVPLSLSFRLTAGQKLSFLSFFFFLGKEGLTEILSFCKVITEKEKMAK